jgi:putative spermidine/putrescine transport system substrate-binding protein
MRVTRFDPRLTRRAALLGAAAVAGSAALPARAADRQVIVGTWGGDYANLLAKNIDRPFLVPQGIEVIQDIASDEPRRNKMAAERRLPRGTTDVQGLSQLNVAQMVAIGVLEKLDFGRMPNARNILPPFRDDYAVPHIYSGLVVLYNPKLIEPAPTGIADLFEPRHAGKVGVIDIQYQWTIMAASLAGGGSMTDFEPGKAKLLELRKTGVKIYPTNEALAQALKAEEIGLCVMWKARAVQWQNAGINIKAVAPREGVPLYISLLAMPRNAPHKDEAYAYLNASLEPQAQVNFAIDMGYNPVVGNATPPAAVTERIGFSESEREHLISPNAEYIVKNDAQLKEWWDKVFKA